LTDCYSCRQNAIDPDRLPPRDAIYDDGLWRVAHAFSSALAGWMVVVSRRHITSLSQLTAQESAALGPVLNRLSSAAEAVTGASKCYVIFLAEAPGFEHLHIHVVPRLLDMPDDRIGIDAMKYLAHPENEWVAPEDMDRISEAIRERMNLAA
jgi:diadenosine tetraphosphate (Ap4A) HIT family hydrolase